MPSMDQAAADRAARLARDWATIWQSELAALGADPETGMAMEKIFAAWLLAAESWRGAIQSRDSSRESMMAELSGPAPMRRRGPRPLLLHLGQAMMRSRSSSGGLPSLSDVSPTWIQGAGTMLGPPMLGPEMLLLDPALVAGIAAYRRHPWRRVMPDMPVIWEEGGTRLVDYGQGGSGKPCCSCRAW